MFKYICKKAIHLIKRYITSHLSKYLMVTCVHSCSQWGAVVERTRCHGIRGQKLQTEASRPRPGVNWGPRRRGLRSRVL